MNRRVPTWAALFLLAAISVGCVIVRSEGFTFRDADPIENSPLRLDGYYYRISDSSRITRGVSIYPLLLWKDGTAVYSNLAQAKHLQDEYKPGEPFKYGTLTQAKAVLERKMDSLLTRSMGYFFHWGRFKTSKDSIFIQVMWFDGNALEKKYRTLEFRGVVPNDTTLILKERTYFNGRHEGSHSIDMKYHFGEFDEAEKPPSANWTQTHPELQ